MIFMGAGVSMDFVRERQENYFMSGRGEPGKANQYERGYSQWR